MSHTNKHGMKFTVNGFITTYCYISIIYWWTCLIYVLPFLFSFFRNKGYSKYCCCCLNDHLCNVLPFYTFTTNTYIISIFWADLKKGICKTIGCTFGSIQRIHFTAINGFIDVEAFLTEAPVKGYYRSKFGRSM